MSKLIKADSVVVGRPKSLDVPPLEWATAGGAALQPVQGGEAAPGGEEDILVTARFEARGVYEQSRKQGVADGFAKGAAEGREAGRAAAEAAAQAAGETLSALEAELGVQLEYTAAQADEEARKLAFAIAAKILGRPLDKADPLFEELSGRRPAAPDEEPPAELEPPIEAFLEPYEAAAAAAAAAPGLGEVRLPRFEDIAELGIEERRELLGSADLRNVILAMRGCGEAVRQAVLEGFDERMRETIEEELDLSGPVLLLDVEKARVRICAAMQRLESVRSGAKKGDDLFV